MTVILLVEDELLIRMSLTDTLVDAGYRVLEARNAAEALEIISARDDVDVLITDVRMPGGMDGITLAREVASRYPAVAIIVTSGHAQPTATDLPEGATLDAAYNRMRTARQQEATAIRAEGQKEAQIIRGNADGEAARIYAASYGKDPEFYDFYRAMISYRQTFLGDDSSGATSIILSPDNEYLTRFHGD